MSLRIWRGRAKKVERGDVVFEVWMVFSLEEFMGGRAEQ